MDYMKEYDRWMTQVTEEDLMQELAAMDEKSIEDAFYRDLAFGTGGLRGVIGAGTNRMDMAKAASGAYSQLCDQILEGICWSYDNV